MSIATNDRQGSPTKRQGDAASMFSSQTAGGKTADITRAFRMALGRSGESFDHSTHEAVIKLMMMTFGQHPTSLFNELTIAGDECHITMKDEFKARLSRDELEKATLASRFEGEDEGVVKDANFVFAVFVKRKQLTGGYLTFEAALEQTLKGEATERCLQGLGVFGLSRRVPLSDLAVTGTLGVRATHSAGSALVGAAGVHRYGEQYPVDQRYGYVLNNDKPVSVDPPGQVIDTVHGMTPAQVWDCLCQGRTGNFVSVSVIKAVIIRFWQDPQGIFKRVQASPHGFEVVMRDFFSLQLTHDELYQAAVASSLHGGSPQLLDYANFLYAVSAKSALLENGELHAQGNYVAALDLLNGGEHPGEGIRRLGLAGYIREGTVEELAKGAVGVLADTGQLAAQRNGQKQDVALSRWISGGFRALQLG